MTCGHCEKAVKDALTQLNGIGSVEVHLDSGKVDIAYDEANIAVDKLKEAIEEQGYDVA